MKDVHADVILPTGRRVVHEQLWDDTQSANIDDGSEMTEAEWNAYIAIILAEKLAARRAHRENAILARQSREAERHGQPYTGGPE